MTTPDPCPNCQHDRHLPGTECSTPVNHGPSRWHLCLCLARPGAALPCPPQMTCQGGTLGYSDVWYLQQGHSLSSADGVISPEVLTAGPVAVGFPSITDQSDPQPAVWIDGHPQLEAIAAAVWERCGRSDSGMCVEDDPRNIAVAALAAVLPASADRAAALTEAADALERLDPVEAALAGQHAWKDAAALLRRLAAEAHDGDTHDDGQPAASRIRDLHQPMQRGPFTICAHCSGWDGRWQCRGVVTDYPCPTVRALDGGELAAVVEHLGGKANAEDCPGCKVEPRNQPYPFLCPAETPSAVPPVGSAEPQDETRVVAYRGPGSGWLFCCNCADGSGMHAALTSDDLPDGGLCDECGVDVLIPQETPRG